MPYTPPRIRIIEITPFSLLAASMLFIDSKGTHDTKDASTFAASRMDSTLWDDDDDDSDDLFNR